MKFDDCDLIDRATGSHKRGRSIEPSWVTHLRLAIGAAIVAALAIAAMMVKDVSSEVSSDARLTSANAAFAAVVARDARDCTPSIIGRSSCLRPANEGATSAR